MWKGSSVLFPDCRQDFPAYSCVWLPSTFPWLHPSCLCVLHCKRGTASAHSSGMFRCLRLHELLLLHLLPQNTFTSLTSFLGRVASLNGVAAFQMGIRQALKC